MNFKRIDLLALILLSIPFVYWYVSIDSIPDRVPIHWGFSGQPDRWVEKAEIPYYFLLMGAFALGIYVFARIISKIDPKKTARLSQVVFDKIGLAVVAFMSSVNFIILYASSNNTEFINAMFFVMSLLFAFLGNVMYNIKPNYFVGFRLPWTLENEYNWRHTHRLAGRVWFAGGLLLSMITLTVPYDVLRYTFIVVIGILIVIPALYSYYLFRKGNEAGAGSH